MTFIKLNPDCSADLKDFYAAIFKKYDLPELLKLSENVLSFVITINNFLEDAVRECKDYEEFSEDIMCTVFINLFRFYVDNREFIKFLGSLEPRFAGMLKDILDVGNTLNN